MSSCPDTQGNWPAGENASGSARRVPETLLWLCPLLRDQHDHLSCLAGPMDLPPALGTVTAVQGRGAKWGTVGDVPSVTVTNVCSESFRTLLGKQLPFKLLLEACVFPKKMREEPFPYDWVQSKTVFIKLFSHHALRAKRAWILKEACRATNVFLQ